MITLATGVLCELSQTFNSGQSSLFSQVGLHCTLMEFSKLLKLGPRVNYRHQPQHFELYHQQDRTKTIEKGDFSLNIEVM